jgi:thiol:disulfide interchange protein
MSFDPFMLFRVTARGAAMARQATWVGSFKFFLAALLAMLLPSVVAAQSVVPPGGAMVVSMEPARPAASPGSTTTLAIVMRPKLGWHGYWKNPGDSGTETRVEWTLPAGVTAGPLQYPVPEPLLISGLMNYVYGSEHALLVDLKVPSNAVAGSSLPVRAKLDYLVCTKEICVPESATVAAELRVGTPGGRGAVDTYRQALPKPLGSQAQFQVDGERVRFGIPYPASASLAEAHFFPLTHGAIDYAAPQSVTREGDMLVIETAAGESAGALKTVGGVLRIGERQGLSLTARPGAVAGAAQGSELSIVAALLGAVLGGLLLNIMPCVFPILSLKALSLAKAGGDERAARHEGLAYTLGAVLTCLALGGALLALRASGEAAGWAFQLQDPRVILILLLLVTAIALNLAGLFELPSLGLGGRLAGAGGAGGAFWTGALAAFVATPCTGPFMGAALGAALVLPAAAALAIFGGLGLGLALPFLLIGFVPALRRRLPRPGPWMNRFRHVLSIPMFLTALALAWVLSRQTGTEGLLLGLAAALILAAALWWLGRRATRSVLPLGVAGAAIVAALFFIPTVAPTSAASQGLPLGAEAFSEARLATLRKEGRPVFVYFTADWCITCKVNEKGALSSGEVERAFGQKKVAVLVGDWTRGEASIGRFLAQHGRSGVPLYLYYEPGRAPEILPQLLTSGRLVALTSS